MGVIGLAGGAGAVAFIQDIWGTGVMKAAFAGTLSEADATLFDSTFAAMGLIQLGLYVAGAISFLAWLSRSVDNVPRLTGGKPKFTPRWAIAWWFVPFANLVMPHQVVADLYRRMAPRQRVATAFVGTWWIVWIIGSITSNVAGRLWTVGTDLADLTFALQLFAISDLADLMAAVLVIWIILRIQRWADSREASGDIGGAREPGPPASQADVTP
jgi:hypothetical protein